MSDDGQVIHLGAYPVVGTRLTTSQEANPGR